MWAWPGVACRSGVSCGGLCTVTRAPGVSPARHLHGHPSMGRGFHGLNLQYPRYVPNTQSISRGLIGSSRLARSRSPAGRVLHGQQVRDELPDQGMPADLLGGDGLGLDEHGYRLARPGGAGHERGPRRSASGPAVRLTSRWHRRQQRRAAPGPRRRARRRSRSHTAARWPGRTRCRTRRVPRRADRRP